MPGSGFGRTYWRCTYKNPQNFLQGGNDFDKIAKSVFNKADKEWVVWNGL
jgi:hypothetical protein